MCSTKEMPSLSIFSTRLKLRACLHSMLQPCGRDTFLRNKLWFCCGFRPNDSVESEWIRIPNHHYHRYAQYFQLHDFPVLCERIWRPGETGGSVQGFQMYHASSFNYKSSSPLRHLWTSKTWLWPCCRSVGSLRLSPWATLGIVHAKMGKRIPKSWLAHLDSLDAQQMTGAAVQFSCLKGSLPSQLSHCFIGLCLSYFSA